MNPSTETVSLRFATLDDWSSADLVSGMVEGQFAAIAAVQAARVEIAQAIDMAAERLGENGRLIYMGAGTSGRIAAQDAAELPPTFNWPYERSISLMAGGQQAFFHAAEGPEDDQDLAISDLDKLGLTGNDVVIAIAASGRTPYVLAGTRHARHCSALTIGIFNNRGAPLGDHAEQSVLLDTGPEIVAGSTRLKAGTAQKVVLNCISTGIMIKLGFVYRGMMVEMLPANLKLQDRAAKMVATLTNASYETAQSALETTGYNIKLATVMIARQSDPAQAQALLAQNGGNLRKTLES